MIIYKVTFPNSKCYIGLTKNTLERRKYNHYNRMYNGSTLHFHHALRKYEGSEVWEIIDTAANYEELKLLEIKYIEHYNSFHKGYNLTLGGDGFAGLVFTEAHRKNIGLSVKGRIPWNKGKIGAQPCTEYAKQLHREHRVQYLKDNDMLSVFDVFEAILVKPGKRGQKAEYKCGNFIGTFTNQQEFSRNYKIPASNINKVLKGERQQCHGLIFRYKE